MEEESMTERLTNGAVTEDLLSIPIDAYSDAATEDQIRLLALKLKRERDRRYEMQNKLEVLEKEKNELFENMSDEITGIISELTTKKVGKAINKE